MKYFILLCDGMADMPVPELDMKTPLECAFKPNMDALAQAGNVGMMNPTPEGCKGGSEVGNLCVLGYDARKYLTGRSPLEAAAIGIHMDEDDVALRCNLVTLSEDSPYSEKTMIDYSSDEITTQEADQLIKALNRNYSSELVKFYTGFSYRHCLIIKNTDTDMTFTPPHNITGQKINQYLPQGTLSKMLSFMMERSYELLKEHPVNIERVNKGLRPANSIWLWGQGRRMSLPSFKEKYGLEGGVITAVDLLKGIANCAGMRLYNVDGATGNLDTNYSGKAQAAIKAFKEGCDLVYLHIEAPDECGHRHEVEGKVKAAEYIDKLALKPVMDYLSGCGEDYKILITPDHPTPLTTGSHSDNPVPFILYDSADKAPAHSRPAYSEKEAEASGLYVGDGITFLEKIIKGEPLGD